MFENTAAVIMAAGLGTRMKSRKAKVLHEVLGRPLVNFPVLLSRELGVGRVVVVVGHGREEVSEVVRRVEPDARFAVQEQQRGTADAVRVAEQATEGCDQVLILSGDVPALRPETVRRLAVARTEADSPLAAVGFEPSDVTGYGRMVTDGAGRLQRIVEHKDATAEERLVPVANAGIYLVEREFLFNAIHNIGSDNAQGEFYLTDIAAMAADAGTPGGVVVVSDPFEVAGVNDRSQLASITERLRTERNLELMKSGITMHDPASTWVGLECRVGRDVTLHRGVTLRGATTVADGARIGEGVVIEASRVGEDAEVKPYCVISESTVGPRAAVGPFAHLRPGTDLGEESKVGNFVEIKKARLGRGSKASHLTYLGDAILGEEVNIGAGTITCNYDGVDKHRTVIEDRVFIGSNTEIVAPVTIGEEALVGAGTTVTQDVPAGALALSRAKQVNVPGWALRAGPVARKRARKERKD